MSLSYSRALILTEDTTLLFVKIWLIMAECQSLSVEEIFSRLFTQERFYNATHIPHFLQTFAPPQVQKLSRDVQTLALLQGATLLASVAPDPVPLFDLPPLPSSNDSRVSKSGDRCRSPNTAKIPFVSPFSPEHAAKSVGSNASTYQASSAQKSLDNVSKTAVSSLSQTPTSALSKSASHFQTHSNQATNTSQFTQIQQKANAVKAQVLSAPSFKAQCLSAPSVSETNAVRDIKVADTAKTNITNTVDSTKTNLTNAYGNSIKSLAESTDTTNLEALSKSQAASSSQLQCDAQNSSKNQAVSNSSINQSVPNSSISPDVQSKEQNADHHYAQQISVAPLPLYAQISMQHVHKNQTEQFEQAEFSKQTERSQEAATCDVKVNVHQGMNAGLRASHCQMVGSCPFEAHKEDSNSFGCKFFVDNSCTCSQAWALSADQNKCVEAVLPRVSKKVWTAAEFEDARAAVRYGLDEDRVQITLCAPLRHLQHKTQLFPLDVKASVRSRLTHCYEVSLYSKICISALVERLRFLRPLMYEMMVCAENAALLHDIGRPPVGKFGEQILRQWIKEVCELYDHELSRRQQDDLKAFNAHAQGLRLAHSIYKLNLSLGQLSALMNTPKTYEELRQQGMTEEAARHNLGLFVSELPLRERILKSGLNTGRHPLSWLLEQCDDLAYILGDLDDAYDRGLLKDSEVLDLIENLIAYLKDNACNSTCDRCISACTCANGCVYPYHSRAELTGEMMTLLSSSNSDEAHASKLGHSYGYGVEPAERDKLTNTFNRNVGMSATLGASSDAATDTSSSHTSAASGAASTASSNLSNSSLAISSANTSSGSSASSGSSELSRGKSYAAGSSASSSAGDTTSHNSTQKSGYKEGRQLSGTAATSGKTASANFVLGGEHDDVLANGLTYIKLDVVLVDSIKHSYCQGKQDSFGVLQLVHGTNPISLREMMKELGVRTLLELLRECLVTYYIDDIIHAICASQYEFFINGELNVTHYGNDAHKAIDFLKRFEQQMVYCHEDIQAIELCAGQHLQFVLHEYGKLLSVSSTEFLNCITNNKGAPLLLRLCRRLPRRCKEAYLDLCGKDMNNERYARIRLILDFISCMTDPFLSNEYEVLSGNTCHHPK